jgi:hypothetical protein
MDGRRLGGGLRSERGLVGHAERVVRGRRPAEVPLPRTVHDTTYVRYQRQKQPNGGRGWGLTEGHRDWPSPLGRPFSPFCTQRARMGKVQVRLRSRLRSRLGSRTHRKGKVRGGNV